jgi:hypothetical protein
MVTKMLPRQGSIPKKLNICHPFQIFKIFGEHPLISNCSHSKLEFSGFSTGIHCFEMLSMD